jgi:proteasome lid subunit RPN8/RPN11
MTSTSRRPCTARSSGASIRPQALALRISRQLLDEIVEHARAEAPKECCGIVATRDDEAVVVHRARNAANSALRYAMDPMEQLKISNAIDDAGHELGVIYHSHTRSDPIPSETDINLAKLGDSDAPAFPGTLYLIVGVKGSEADLRLWSIVGNTVEQVDFQVTE